jgi:HEAT repeat protein
MQITRDVTGPIQALKCTRDAREDEVVRYEVAEALGRIGAARAVKPLTQALTDAETSVRVAAQQALATLRKLRPDA